MSEVAPEPQHPSQPDPSDQSNQPKQSNQPNQSGQSGQSDQRLFFLLQRAAHRLRTAADRRCVAAAGVTTAQLGALFAVRERPGGTQRQLAGTLGLRESAVTALVARLTAAGLVVRRPHPREHRAVVLELTDEGAAALLAAQPEIDRFNGEVRDLLGDQGFARTSAALHALAHWDPG